MTYDTHNILNLKKQYISFILKLNVIVYCNRTIAGKNAIEFIYRTAPKKVMINHGQAIVSKSM